MGLLTVGLTLISMLCFVPSLQKFFSRLTGGWLSTAAMPWLGILTAYALCIQVLPFTRGVIFGAALLFIAYMMQFVAKRRPTVKAYIQNAFFSGLDIWKDKNFKVSLSTLWTAGLFLMLPLGSFDVLLNIGPMILTGAWFIYQARIGTKKFNGLQNNVVSDSDSSTTSKKEVQST